MTLCTYVGREVILDHQRVPIYNMKVKDNPNHRFVPIEKYIQDPTEPERYRVLTQLDYSRAYPHYEQQLGSFMLFTTEKPQLAKKPVFLKYFCSDELPDLKSFAEIGLPLR